MRYLSQYCYPRTSLWTWTHLSQELPDPGKETRAVAGRESSSANLVTN